MDSLLTPLLSYLLLYRYVALAFVVYIGAVGAPLPVNEMLLALGAFASQGYFSFWGSLMIAVIANCLGDLTGYAITRKWGDWIVRVLHLRKARFFVHLEEELRSDAAITVFTTRFAGSLSSITNLLAGLVRVPLGTFIFYDFIANVIEPAAALGIGYVVGNYWSDFSNLFTIIAAIFAVGIIMFVLIRIQRKIMKKYE
jgi:membrane protein DedA with SNARE-associated domain